MLHFTVLCLIHVWSLNGLELVFLNTKITNLNRYFFYTDPTNLPSTQLTEQAFGPVLQGDSKHESGFDKYRITNLHTATNAPAIAVCDGIICVQKDDNSTYSIILKPNYQPPFDFPYIKYFIYKGILPSSLVNGTALADQSNLPDSQQIPFIKDIREDKIWDEPDYDISKSAKVLGLEYEKNKDFDVNGTPTTIFNDDDPIDNCFYYPNTEFTLPLVRAGDKIGEFAGTFGFEIVLERLGYEPKLELARVFENYIRVESIDNPLNEVGHSSGKVWAVDDADYFLHWHKKEVCLNYVDACAFYGSFAGGKVFYRNNGSKKKANKSKEIYDEIVSKFYNKNVVYLDIRNEFNYSALHTKSKNLTFKLIEKENTVIETDIRFNRNNWGLTILEENDFSIVSKKLKCAIKYQLANDEKLVVLENTKSEPRLNLLKSVNQYSDEIPLKLNVHNNHLISTYHQVYLKYIDETPNYPNLTPRDEYKGDNLLNFSKSIYNAIKLLNKTSVIFFWNQKNISYKDNNTFYVSTPAICLNNNNVILFSMPQNGFSEGKYFKARDFSNKFMSKDLQIEEVLDIVHVSLKSK